MSTWARWSPDATTATAGMLTLAAIAASFAAGATGPLGFFMFRDLVQVIGVGIIAPFALAQPGEWSAAGVRFDRPLRYVAVSVGLGGLLFARFATEAGTTPRDVDANLLAGAAYVMATNVFEVLFFACFLRARFERAFGIAPSIALASLAYSLHHAGFQPEYVKLFFVGVLFLGILRLARHWLVLFPLWWIGGLGDVLFRSPETVGVDWLAARAGPRALLIAVVIVGAFVATRSQPRSNR